MTHQPATASLFAAASTNTNDRSPPTNSGRPDTWLTVVRQAVGTLRFGIVQIVVHDGQVTQIERTERMRLEKAPLSHDT